MKTLVLLEGGGFLIENGRKFLVVSAGRKYFVARCHLTPNGTRRDAYSGNDGGLEITDLDEHHR